MVHAAQWLQYKLGKASAPEPATAAPKYDDPTVLNGVVERWLANKRMIESVAAAYGVRAIFVWQPMPLYKYDLRYHFFLHNNKAFGGFVRAGYGYRFMANLEAQGKLGSDVLWLADMQENKHENLYVDSVHYTAAFSKEIAGKICANIQGDARPSSGR
jgi:hypothetical protein